jgi:UDP-glucose 4-epimerase
MPGVAVTGGAGFLGSNIVRRLADEGRDAVIIDDFSSGSEQNLSDLGLRNRCVRGDLRDHGFAKRSLEGVDTVFHFAAEVGNATYLHGSDLKELAALHANLVIDANVFRACVENHVGTVIFASSVSVYPFGEQLGRSAHFREEDSERSVDPEGGYGWAKYIAEKQLQLMAGVSYGVARIFHAYGRNIYIKPDRSQVIASFIRKAINYPKEGFVVLGDGTQKRCFVFVDDVLDAIMLLERHTKERGSLTVNVGSTDEVTVRELAERVVALSGKDIPLNFDGSKPVGALSRKPDLGRAKEVLGWSPATPLSEGLAETFKWAEERLKTPGGRGHHGSGQPLKR